MRVRWTKRARAQLLEIFDFIAEERPLTAERVVGRLRDATQGLARFPLRGRKVPEFDNPAIRERLVSPHRIIYTVQGDDIFILAVYDGRRLLPEDPEDL